MLEITLQKGKGPGVENKKTGIHSIRPLKFAPLYYALCSNHHTHACQHPFSFLPQRYTLPQPILDQ
jgi:hypothetical protein